MRPSKLLNILLIVVPFTLASCGGNSSSSSYPEKIKDGETTIDLSSGGSSTISVKDYITNWDCAGISFDIQYDSSSIYVWDVENYLFTIDGRSPCTDVPVEVHVLIQDTESCFFTITANVLKGTPKAKKGFDPHIEVFVNETGETSIPVTDIVDKQGASGLDYSLSSQSESIDGSVNYLADSLVFTAANVTTEQDFLFEISKKGTLVLSLDLFVSGVDSSIVPSKIKDGSSTIDLSLGQAVSVQMSDYVNAIGARKVTYEAESSDGDGFARKTSTNTFDLLPSKSGTSSYLIHVYQDGTLAFDVSFLVHAMNSIPENVINGDFETGAMKGWRGTGSYSTDTFVCHDEDFYGAMHLPYHKQGTYFLHGAIEGALGTAESSYFRLAGNGWISFLMGAGASLNESYLSLYSIDSSGVTEAHRFGNTEFYDKWGYTSTDIGVDTFLYNLASYSFDLGSENIGNVYFFKYNDLTTSGFYGGLTIDDIRVNLDQVPETDFVASDIQTHLVGSAPSSIENPGFETGSFDGWNVYANSAVQEFSLDFSDIISSEEYWWPGIEEQVGGKPSYNQEGKYHYSGNYFGHLTFTTRSSIFSLSGNGMVSFKMGYGMNMEKCYLSVYKYVDGGSDEEIARFGNTMFYDLPNWTIDDVGVDCFLLNMVDYVYDLSDYLGENLYFQIVDLGITQDGYGEALVMDDFRTDYDSYPSGYEAENLI